MFNIFVGPPKWKKLVLAMAKAKTDFFSFSSVFSFQEAKEQILPLKMLNKTFFFCADFRVTGKKFQWPCSPTLEGDILEWGPTTIWHKFEKLPIFFSQNFFHPIVNCTTIVL